MAIKTSNIININTTASSSCSGGGPLGCCQFVGQVFVNNNSGVTVTVTPAGGSPIPLGNGVSQSFSANVSILVSVNTNCRTTNGDGNLICLEDGFVNSILAGQSQSFTWAADRCRTVFLTPA